MSAIYLPDAVASSSTGPPTPYPIAPISGPVDVSAVDSGVIVTPIILTSQSITSINTPVVFSAKNAGEIGIPVIVTPETIASINIPTITTAINVGAIDAPVISTAINVGAISTPVINTAINAGAIDTPTITTAVSVASINTPVINTAVSVGAITTPVINTAINVGAITTPVITNTISKGAIDTPAVTTAINVGAIDAPVISTAINVGAISTPVINTAINAGAIDTPTITTAVSAGAIDTPVINTAVAVAATATPVLFTPESLPSSNPPFALNHARILYNNLLINSTVSINTGTNGNLTLVPNTADRWTFPNVAASNVIRYTLSTNANIDTFCVGAHNIGSVGASVKVLYNTTLGGVFTQVSTTFTPTDDTAIMFHLSASVSAREIQIKVEGGSGSVFVGSIYAGIALQMQRPFFTGHSPINLSANTIRYSSMTEGGNFIGEQVRRLGFKTSASFSNLENDWYRFYFQPFVIHARTLPYYFAWNLSQYPLDVGYCKTSADISPSYGSRDTFDVGFDMVGFG